MNFKTVFNLFQSILDGTARLLSQRPIRVCRQQIAMADKAARAFQTDDNWDSLLGHMGYSQLAIIFERQKHFDQAIELYAQAMHQGWSGDWEKHIERCKKKMLSA